jgi:uncharacterized membrane protein YcaP (DUF421 family)
MKKEEIHFADWHRIFIGSAPAEFLLEVVIRTVIMYLMLLLILRLMGKRMGGQLTISELAVMLTLGAIVSVPMQVADKGLLQGILVLVCALFFQRGLSYLAVKNAKIEHLTQGWESLVVKDGVLQSDQLKAMKISREQLFGVLRNQKVYNLGEIRRVYLEACGLFTIFKYPDPRPGLLLVPIEDGGNDNEFSFVDSTPICDECGNAAHSPNNEKPEKCTNCGSHTWTSAVIAKQS